MQEKAYEFIDFYCYGIAHQYLKKAGFSLLSQEDGNIIPNYFEPFERENVKIRIVVAHCRPFICTAVTETRIDQVFREDRVG